MGGVIVSLCAKDTPWARLPEYRGKPTPPKLGGLLVISKIHSRALGLVALGPSRQGFHIRPTSLSSLRALTLTPRKAARPASLPVSPPGPIGYHPFWPGPLRDLKGRPNLKGWYILVGLLNGVP